ncbi:MAG: 30S ribosomal protein S17 [archaeon]
MKKTENECKDRHCPLHGKLRVRGRYFDGEVTKIFGQRAVIEFERRIFIKKYERYAKAKTKLHAHIPICMEVKVGDLVTIGECRPISTIKKFVIVKK